MKLKPKILIIENSIDITGALNSITRTSYDLKNHFEFQFVIPSKSNCKSLIERKGFSMIYELPLREISRRVTSLIVYLPFLLLNGMMLHRLIKRKSISLIHVNDLYNLLPIIIRLFGNRTPYVCHIRFLPNRFPKLLFHFWFKLHTRFAKKIVVVSQSVFNQLPDHKNTIIIYNELPIKELHPDLYRKPGDFPYIFLYLSNFIQGKGQDYALEAFAKIHDQIPEWRLRFIGGDMGLIKNQKYRDKLKARADSLGISDKIEWKGFTEEVEWEYKQADIALNFSESESFSITCLEALFFGTPVIATDCGGPAEIIEHGRTGLIVRNKDITAMTESMEILAKDSNLREKIRNEAKVSVRKRFDIEKTSYRLKEVYDYALK